MDNKLTVHQKLLVGRALIALAAFLSLLCFGICLLFSVGGGLPQSFRYDYISLPETVTDRVLASVSWLLSFLPYGMAGGYLLFFYGRKKAKMAGVLLFVTMALRLGADAPIWLIRHLGNMIALTRAESFGSMLEVYTLPLLDMGAGLLQAAFYLLTGFLVYKGKRKREDFPVAVIPLAAAVLVGMFTDLTGLVHFFTTVSSVIGAKAYGQLFSVPVLLFGLLTQRLLLLAVGLVHGFLPVAAPVTLRQKRVVEHRGTEEALRLLETKRDLGIITKEQYNAHCERILK